MTRGRSIPYSQAELNWIEAHKSLPRRELHSRFRACFDRPDVSQQNLTELCKRRGWLTGRSGRFEKGMPSQFLGKKRPAHWKKSATVFRKGQRAGKASHLWKPIGTERITNDGYIERKIHDGMPLQSRWKTVHSIRWEQINGPVPEGHYLKCLDGDKTNTDPSNWKALPRAMSPRLNGGRAGRLAYDDAPPALKPTLLAIAELEHAARRRNRGEKP